MSDSFKDTNHFEASSAVQDERLKKAKTISEFLKQLRQTENQTLSQYLNALLAGKEGKVTISKIVDSTSLNKSYVYRVFAFDSKEKPSRETLLEISIAMGLTVDETNRILKLGKCSALRAKDERDAIIYFGLLHGQSYDDINEALRDNKQPCLGDKHGK